MVAIRRAAASVSVIFSVIFSSPGGFKVRRAVVCAGPACESDDLTLSLTHSYRYEGARLPSMGGTIKDMTIDSQALGFGVGERANYAADPWATRGRLYLEPSSPTRS